MMKLKTRITSTSLVLAIVPLMLACFVVGYYSYQSGREALEAELEKSLVTLRDIKKEEVESYVNYISDQVLTHARSKSVIDAAKEFKFGFNTYLEEAIPDAGATDALHKYYKQEFASTYREKNNQKSTDVDALLRTIGDTATALQARYIGRNPHPLGGKDELLSYQDGSGYSLSHQTYHPELRYYLQTFGYYDIFIVDPANGNVVYSLSGDRSV
jgi:methyl-accepting chemotaxis protein